MSKALRALKGEGRVMAAKDERGNMVWWLAGLRGAVRWLEQLQLLTG